MRSLMPLTAGFALALSLAACNNDANDGMSNNPAGAPTEAPAGEAGTMDGTTGNNTPMTDGTTTDPMAPPSTSPTDPATPMDGSDPMMPPPVDPTLPTDPNDPTQQPPTSPETPPTDGGTDPMS